MAIYGHPRMELNGTDKFSFNTHFDVIENLWNILACDGPKLFGFAKLEPENQPTHDPS
jgi:hypothetical protein